MTRRIVAVVLVGFVTTFAAAQPTGLPKTAAPAFAAVAGFDPVSGVVRFVEQEAVPVTEKRKVKATTGGNEPPREVEVTVTVYQYTPRESERRLADFALQTADGEAVSAEKAVAMLKQNRLVLLARGNEPIDPEFLKLIDKATLVFNHKKGRGTP